MSRRRVALVAAFLVVAAAAVGGLVAGRAGDRSAVSGIVTSEGPYRGSEPPARFSMPSFALRDESGRLVRSDDLRRKVVLVTFLDSQCTESCPVIAFQVARAIDSLRPAERSRVVALAISTDPAEDTRKSVRDFLHKNRATGRLSYLGGGEPVPTLRTIWKSFQILSSLESGKDTLHSAPVRVYDRDGIWVATLHPAADLTPQNLAHDVRVALGR